MRWLFVVVLGACQFTPGVLATTDAPAPGDDARRDGMPDMMTVASDGALDGTTPLPGLRRLIDLDDAKITGAPHADFPLFVAITASWLRDGAHGGDVLRADGYDIYFSSDLAGAAKLAHEVEVYDPATGTLAAWVKIPSLVPTTTLYLQYANPAITTDQQQRTAVWSGGYAQVVHMNGTGDATGNVGTIGGTSSGAANGKCGEARRFNGNNDYGSGGSGPAIANVWAGGGTAEAWFYADTFGEAGFGRLFDKNQWILYVADTQVATRALGFAHDTMGPPEGRWFTTGANVTVGTWHHAAVVYDKGSAANDPVIYLDGVAQNLDEYDVPIGVLASDENSTLVLGNNATLDRAFDGLLDEMRLSTVMRSAGWIATQYRNTADPATFYTISAPL